MARPRLVLLSLPVLLLAAAPGKWFQWAGYGAARGRRAGRDTASPICCCTCFRGFGVIRVPAGEELETRNSLERARRYFNELVAAAHTEGARSRDPGDRGGPRRGAGDRNRRSAR